MCRYGLVGPNGYGKTTVLRFLAERRLPVPDHISCLHVEQEVPASHRSALSTVLAADTQRAALAADLERIQCMLDSVTAEVSDTSLIGCVCGRHDFHLRYLTLPLSCWLSASLPTEYSACEWDAYDLVSQGRVSSLEKSLESLGERLEKLHHFELSGLQFDDNDDEAVARQTAADRELFVTLTESKSQAEQELSKAREWLVSAQKLETAEENGADAHDSESMALILEMEQLYEQLDAISADAAESRACKVLAGLGFSSEMQQSVFLLFCLLHCSEDISFMVGGLTVGFLVIFYRMVGLLTDERHSSSAEVGVCVSR